MFSETSFPHSHETVCAKYDVEQRSKLWGVVRAVDVF